MLVMQGKNLHLCTCICSIHLRHHELKETFNIMKLILHFCPTDQKYIGRKTMHLYIRYRYTYDCSTSSRLFSPKHIIKVTILKKNRILHCNSNCNKLCMKITIRTINKSDTCIKVISKEILVLDQKNKKSRICIWSFIIIWKYLTEIWQVKRWIIFNL